MTQPVLAEKLAQRGVDISYKTISGWEKGLTEPPIGAFIEICRILEVQDIYEAEWSAIESSMQRLSTTIVDSLPPIEMTLLLA